MAYVVTDNKLTKENIKTKFPTYDVDIQYDPRYDRPHVLFRQRILGTEMQYMCDLEAVERGVFTKEHLDREMSKHVQKELDKSGVKMEHQPKHISSYEYDMYMRECRMRNIMPDPYIRPMYNDYAPETTKPSPAKPKQTTKKSNQLLLVIKSKGNK